MRFSIIIPSYGQAQYLREAIESAIHQDYPAYDFEVIVVDDGSTDGSFEIAKEYRDTIIIVRQINKGLAAARNTGIMNAGGTWIVPLDADDILLPSFLAEIRKNITDRVDVIAPSVSCFNEEGETQDTILMPNPTFDDFKEGNRLAYCAAIRRSILVAVGGYSSRYDALGGWEDLALWYDLLRRGDRIITLQKPLMKYRVKKDSMITRTKGKERELWAQIVKDFPEAKDHVK